MNKKIVAIFLVIIILILGYCYQSRQVPLYIANYEECVRMGGQIIGTSSEQCIYKDGKKFIKEAITTVSETSDLANQSVKEDCSGIDFKDFSVGEIYQKKSATPDFASNPDAENFLTAISEAMLGQSNFAGHYIVVEIGCGTACQQHAIVDAVNGKIIVFGLQTNYGIETKPDSKLLIINPSKNLPDTQEESAATVYYELSATSQLEEICREQNQDKEVSLEPQVKKYEDKKIGFSFVYPESVTLVDTATNTSRGLRLRVEKNKIDELDGTIGYDKKTALLDQEALKAGEYGEELDWPIQSSKNFLAVNGINAKEFTVLGRFEVCDVTFERKLIFYLNNYQVILTLYGDKESIISSMPEYFTLDEKNCGKNMIWKGQDSFYKALETKDGSVVAQFWFDSFNNIVQTINQNK